MKLIEQIKKVGFLIFVVALLSTAVWGQTVYVDVTNGSDSYTGANPTNNPAGTGPVATFAKGISLLSDGGTLVIKAGTYAEAFDLSTGLASSVNGYTIQVTQLNANNVVDFTGGAAVINKSGLTVNITQANGTEKITTSGTTTLNMTAGSINLSTAAAWVLTNGTTINLVGTSGFTNAAPTAGSNVSLNYTGSGTFNAGPESAYGSYGTGTITVGKSGGTVTFPNAISFGSTNSAVVINVTGGSATFSSTVNAGRGDIVNSGTGTVTFNGALSLAVNAGAGVADADLSSIRNTSTGSIVVNAASTWTGGNFGGSKTYPAALNTYLIVNSSTGSVTLGAISLVADNTGGSGNYTVTVSNGAGASLTLGSITAASSGSNGFFGVLNFNNAGTATIGGGTYRGTFTNSSSCTVTGATTVYGTLTNSGTLALGSNVMTLSDGGTAHGTAGGTITNSTGKLVEANTAGTSSFNGGTFGTLEFNSAGTVNILSSTTIGTFNLTAGTVGINAALSVTDLNVTGATATTGAAVTVSGTTAITGGTLNNGNFTYTTTHFTQNGGTFALNANAASILDVKGNFNRTTGTFTAGAASLVSFTGSGAQSVNGGTLFQVSKLTFTNVGGTITVGNSIRASGDVVISTATNLDMSTLNLILNGTNNKITNNGTYTATGGGGVVIGGVNTVTGGVAGAGAGATYVLDGTGTYSFITIDVGAGNLAEVKNTVTGVKFNGVLTLRSGTLDVATAGVDFGPVGSNASIVRYPQDAPGITTSLGTFNAANISYDLTYTGAITANKAVGSEITATPANVRTWTIQTTGAFLNTLPAGANLTFGGTLVIANTAELNLPTGGATAFVLSGTGKTHTILGKISFADGGDNLSITGASVTVNGGTATADVATIGNVSVSSSTNCTFTNIKSFNGTFTTTAGSVVSVGMGSTAANQIIAGAITLGGASFAITTNITSTAGVTHNAGTFDFGGNNFTTNAAFTQTGGSYTSSGGYLIFGTAANLTLTSAIPYLRANNVVITLASNITVSQNLDITGAGTPAIANGGNNCTIQNGMTTVGGSVFTGTGALILAGTTVTASGNVTVSNLTINSTGTATLASNNSTARTFTVTGVLTQTAGTLALGANNISLTGTGGAFSRAAGSITASTGELQFSGGGGQTGAQGTGFSIPNLTINNAAGVTFAANDFTVTGNLKLTSGAFSSTTAGKLHIGAGGTIIRVADVSSLTEVPTFDGDVNLVYKNITATPQAMANEVPTAASGKLNNVEIDAGAGKTINTGAATTFKGTATLTSGTWGNAGGAITVASGATILMAGGAMGQAPTVTNYNLTYSTGGAITTTNNEFISGKVDLLTVQTAGTAVTLNANKTLKDFTITAGSFELAGNTLTATGNVNVAGGNLTNGTATGSLVFGGTAAQTFTVPSGGLTLGGAATPVSLTINNAAGVTLAGGNLTMNTNGTVNGIINFTSGLFNTGSFSVILAQTGASQGYAGASQTAGYIVGNVAKTLATGNTGRFEFPIGTTNSFRPVAFTFLAASPVTSGTTITVSANDTNPGGSTGFPLTYAGVTVDTTADFSWQITSSVSLGPSQTFDVEFQGTGFPAANYPGGSVSNLRVISRLGSVTTNSWAVQGGNYLNFESVAGLPIVRVTNSTGNLISQGATFTFGFKKPVATYSVSGKVLYANSSNSPVKNVVVTLNPGGATSTTDSTGAFSFSGLANGSYTLSASTTKAWPSSAVNATDAFLVAQGYAGVTTLSAIQNQAADVNVSGSVNNTDALLIVRRFAGLTTSFAAGDWAFVTPSVTVNGANVSTANISCLAMGDVNASASAGSLQKIAAVNLESDGVSQVDPKKSFIVPVKVGGDVSIAAMSLRFTYPKDMVTLESVSSVVSGLVTHDDNGVVSIGWIDETGGKQLLNLKAGNDLLIFKFKPTEKFVENSSIGLGIEKENSEFAGADGHVLPGVMLKTPSAESTIPLEFSLAQNYPNPFNPSTIIQYTLKEKGSVKLAVYNVLGQLVTNLVDQEQEAGVYKYNFNASNLASGAYFYRISVKTTSGQNFTQIHSMMLLK